MAFSEESKAGACVCRVVRTSLPSFGQRKRLLDVLQIWWLLCTLVLVSVPYTLWEYKENGFSSKYAGMLCASALALGFAPKEVLVLNANSSWKFEFKEYALLSDFWTSF